MEKARASRRLRLTALVLASIGVLWASAASASAARPEFEYSGVNEGASLSFTVKNVTGSASFVATFQGAWQCYKMSGSGHLTGPKSGTAVLKLSECGSGLPRGCHSGTKLTELETTELSVTPVYVPSEGEKPVAILFKPVKGETLAKLNCTSGGPAELKGSILALLGAGGASKERSLTFSTVGSPPEISQNPSKYENEKGEVVSTHLELGYTLRTPEWIPEAWSSPDELVTPQQLSILH